MTQNYMYSIGKKVSHYCWRGYVEGRHEPDLMNGRDLELMRWFILGGGKHLNKAESLK